MVKLRILCVLVILIRTGHSQLSQILANTARDCRCERKSQPNSIGSLASYQEKTIFRFHSRRDNFIIMGDNPSALRSFGFDPKLPLKVITHGLLERPGSAWMNEVKDALLSGSQPDMNVVIVDWGHFSRHPFYNDVANHVAPIGRVLAAFLWFIQDTYPDFSAKQVHLIGFSMGAHVSGIAGQNFPGIGRITGLDPAGPVFKCFSESDRLSKDDADFVDIVHSNGGCLKLFSIGYSGRAGHQDFYINGGSVQPGCSSYALDTLSSVADFLTNKNPHICHHHRAINYFIESITAPEISYGYQCPSIKAFKSGDCLDSHFRAAFGYNAKPGPEGKFYLETQRTLPYLQRILTINITADSFLTPELDVIGPNKIPNKKVKLSRNIVSQRPEQIYLGTVGIPLSARVTELSFIISYWPTFSIDDISSKNNPYLYVFVTDVNSNEMYCEKPLRSNWASRSYSLTVKLAPCPSDSNLS